MRFTVVDDQIVLGDKVIGPANALLADGQELKGLGEKQGVKHTRMAYEGVHIDMMMAVGDVVIGIEGKKPDDLRTSHTSRRLAKQIKALLESCDIAVLLVRPVWSLYKRKTAEPNFPLFKALAEWQGLGVYVLPGPTADADVPSWLNFYRAVLKPRTEYLLALEGTDSPLVTKDERKSDGYLLHGVHGLGSKQFKKLREAYGSTFEALVSSDAEWKALGIRSNVIEQRRKGLL